MGFDSKNEKNPRFFCADHQSPNFMIFLTELEIDWTHASAGWNEKRTSKDEEEDVLWEYFFEEIISQNYTTLKKLKLLSTTMRYANYNGRFEADLDDGIWVDGIAQCEEIEE